MPGIQVLPSDDHPFLEPGQAPPGGSGVGNLHTATDGRDILINTPDGWEVDRQYLWWDGPADGDGTGGPFGNPPPDAQLGPTGQGWATPVVSRCLQLTADKIAAMPWKTYRGRELIQTPSWILDPQNLAADGRRQQVTTKLVRFSAVDFWSQHLRSMILLGEGITYTPRVRDEDDQPTGPIVAPLYNLNPDILELTSDGRWWVPDPDNVDGEFPGWSEIDSRELLVTRYVVRPGHKRGLGVLKAHAADLGFAAHVRGFADNLLRRGVPNGWLKSSKPDLDQQQANELKRSWMRSHGGVTKSIAVLNATTEFHPIQLDPQTMAYIDMKRLSAWELALAFGVPGGKLGISMGNSMQYETLEMANTEFVQDTLIILARKMEAAIDAVLALGTELKIDFNQMLRADTTGRYAAYQTGLDAGFLTIDEVRAFEDLPPMPTNVAPPAAAPAPDDQPVEIQDEESEA
jgi:HK97 family phage portal protein